MKTDYLKAEFYLCLFLVTLVIGSGLMYYFINEDKKSDKSDYDKCMGLYPKLINGELFCINEDGKGFFMQRDQKNTFILFSASMGGIILLLLSILSGYTMLREISKEW